MDLKRLFDKSQDGSPAQIAELSRRFAGRPPATIINAELDPLRTEGEELARRLEQSGVRVDQRTYSGVTHEFFGMGAAVSKAKEAVQQAGTALRGAFGGR